MEAESTASIRKHIKAVLDEIEAHIAGGKNLAASPETIKVWRSHLMDADYQLAKPAVWPLPSA